MALLETELSVELDRVITCPYPASLVTLGKHLVAAKTLDVRAMISDRPPCAITKLASVVAAALPLWKDTIDILRILSESSEFRDTLLIQEPRLLNDVLIETNLSPGAFQEYYQLCVRLLSRPLPPSVPLPASAQGFFLRVLEQACATEPPNEGAFKSLYFMLNGACKDLLRLLSSKARQAIDEKLSYVLSKYSTAQYSMLRLWCFGLTILAEHPGALDSGALPFTSALRWRSKAGIKIFEKDAYKSLKLIQLNVVWGTKGGVGVTDADALEGVRIANQTLHCMAPDVREKWTSSDENTSNIEKLYSRTLRKDIDSAVQLETLCFYASTSDRSGLSPELVAKYLSALAQTIPVAETHYFRKSISISLPLFAPLMQEAGVHQILFAIMELNVSPRSTLSMANMEAICDVLSTVITDFPQVRAWVISVISSPAFQSMIASFMQTRVGSGDPYAQSCSSNTAVVHRSLISSTISMLLTTAFSSASSESSFPQSIVIALLKRQQHLQSVSSQCTHAASSSNPSPLSILQQECTPLSNGHLQDWKDTLHFELENQDKYQRDHIVRSFARLCHDLETRCETAEAPLKAEKEKSIRLTEEKEDLRKQNKDLENKQTDDEDYRHALEIENDRLETEIANIQEEKQKIDDQLARLQKEFDDANIKAKIDLIAAQENHDDQRVRFQSTILKFEEAQRTLFGLSDQLEQEKVKHNSLRDQLMETKHDLDSEQATARQQKRKVSLLEDELESQQRTNARQKEEVNNEREKVSQQTDELFLLKNELKGAQQTVSRLGLELKSEKQTLFRLELELKSEQQTVAQQKEGLSRLAEELKSENQMVSQQQEDLSRIEGEKCAVEGILQDAKLELSTVAEHLSDLQSRHEELAQSSKEALEKLEEQYENDVKVAELRAKEDYNQIHAELQEALRNVQEVNEACQDARNSYHELHATISPLKARIDKLTDACSEKDVEIERMRTERKGMLACLGVQLDASLESGYSTETLNPRPTHSHRRRKSTVQAQEAVLQAPASTQTTFATAMENVTKSSFTDSPPSPKGSTPKRPKPSPQPSLKVPATRAQILNNYTSRSSAKRPSPAKRAALRPISPNRRHTTIGFAGPGEPGDADPKRSLPHRHQRGSLHDSEQLDIDVDYDLLTSMPMMEASERLRQGEQDEDNSVTIDQQ